ncbi:alpha/beta fold hydrolase [Sphingorhabdus arenilitoris]|uniref:Alpha/beta fold hydrolase n=1 Tax=Sphingorhabdus arenilitoris TaxID=1490041 RepID=A0ABV8RHJ8_9SPHN
MTEVNGYFFTSFDGVKLAVHECGAGRPVLLLHGLFSHAEMNWIKFGHAAKLAAAGFRVIMPDFRAHGQSEAPHDPAAYPEDVLMTDILALLDHLAMDDFDLGGFSLGARTTAKLLCQGITPRRAILAGMGWEGLQGWDSRRQFFVDAIHMRDTVQRTDPHFMAVQFFKSQKIDPVASLLMLDSFGPMQTEKLPNLQVPIAVICGAEDSDNGSAPLLAEKLAQATYIEIPGTHMSSVTQGELGDAMAEFLIR